MSRSKEKNNLRQKHLALRRGLSSEEKYQKEAIIAHKTFRFLRHCHSELSSDSPIRVGAYIPYIDEVNIFAHHLAAAAEVENTYAIALPHFKRMGTALHFYTLSLTSQLSHFIEALNGTFASLNPNLPIWEEADPDSIHYWLIPGVVFTPHGDRIGFGKGVYDRFLSKFTHGIRIGLAFDIQMTQSFVSEALDVPMHVVFTETQTHLPPHAHHSLSQKIGDLS